MPVASSATASTLSRGQRTSTWSSPCLRPIHNCNSVMTDKCIQRALLALSFATLPALEAQPKPGTEASACVDSKLIPKLADCHIDTCERKDPDQRTVAVREDDKGDVVTAAIDGRSRSVMYECSEDTTPAIIVQHAAEALRTAGFTLLYQFVGMEGALTARKDDVWMLLEAASHYYTLTEMNVAVPEFESIVDAPGFGDAIVRYGHVPVYGIQFLPGRAELTPESGAALREIATMLEAHPEWRIRVAGHTDNT